MIILRYLQVQFNIKIMFLIKTKIQKKRCNLNEEIVQDDTMQFHQRSSFIDSSKIVTSDGT